MHAVIAQQPRETPCMLQKSNADRLGLRRVRAVGVGHQDARLGIRRELWVQDIRIKGAGMRQVRAVGAGNRT